MRSSGGICGVDIYYIEHKICCHPSGGEKGTDPESERKRILKICAAKNPLLPAATVFLPKDKNGAGLDL